MELNVYSIWIQNEKWCVMARNNEIDMCNGPILGKIVRFAIPLMLSGLLQLLFNAADTAIVGQFCGSLSMAAVGSNGPVVNLLVNLFIGFSVGTNVLVARYVGRGIQDGVSRAVHASILFSVLIGLLIGCVGVFFSPQLLRLVSVPDDVLPLATVYLRIYFIGIPATVVYNFGAAVLRAVGDTKNPLYYMTVAGASNVICNVLFVVVCRWDVAGVAAATALSQYIAAFLVLRCLIKKETSCKLEFRKLRLYKREMLEIVRIGLPAGLQSSLFAISNVLIQSAINTFGAAVIAGNSAAGNIEGFIGIVTSSISQAGVSFISQNLGAEKPERVKRVVINCYSLAVSVGMVVVCAIYTFGRPLLGIFSSEPEVVDAGMIRIGIVSVSQIICGNVDISTGIVRGLGKSWLPMIITLLGTCVVRILWVYTVFARVGTLKCLYTAYPVTWTLTLIAQVTCVVVLLRRLKQRQTVQQAF